MDDKFKLAIKILPNKNYKLKNVSSEVANVTNISLQPNEEIEMNENDLINLMKSSCPYNLKNAYLGMAGNMRPTFETGTHIPKTTFKVNII